MKKILAFFLCVALLLALTGCGGVYYKAGNYEKALEIYEKQGNTEYLNKCRFMLLYNYIIAKGTETESGNYALYDSYLSNTGGVSLIVDPKVPGVLQVLFYIQEYSGGITLNYEINLFLTLDENTGTFLISRTKTTGNGNTLMTDAEGKVDVSTYTAGDALEFSNTNNFDATPVLKSVEEEMYAYFSLAVDSLHEFLQLVDMGTTVNHLGFDAWEYVE